eukprot:NODE_462_length_7167_cov_0.402518.p3 type:complete len:283 gc:universal NODE_462_length_7167_cov_0.402518:1412-564(-)
MLMVFLPSIYSLSRDCPDMINLAIGLNMSQTDPLIYNQMITDCCNVNGYVVCTGSNSTQRVKEIRFDFMKINGVINSTAIPNAVTIFSVYINSVKGPIPDDLPSSIRQLTLGSNKMYGQLPIKLPPNLITLELVAAKFNGSLEHLFDVAPHLQLFQGWLCEYTRIPNIIPKGPYMFRVNGNKITGNLPSIPTSITYLDVSNNFMTGCVQLSTLYYEAYLKYNLFQGPLIIQKPIQFDVSHNHITNVTILDATGLTKCDLSFNPLAYLNDTAPTNETRGVHSE